MTAAVWFGAGRLTKYTEQDSRFARRWPWFNPIFPCGPIWPPEQKKMLSKLAGRTSSNAVAALAGKPSRAVGPNGEHP